LGSNIKVIDALLNDFADLRWIQLLHTNSSLN
jgi:hypothetical protein